ncbi:MAG: DUF975 family protein [Eubacterium sp.]|nr:DUF975 family protein [Eubacterium sp.]
MNFNRISIKTRAKQILRKNWGWAILVTLIFTFTTPTVSSSFIRDEFRDFYRPNVTINQYQNSNGDVNMDVDNDASPGINGYNPNDMVRRYMYQLESTFRSLFPDYQGPIWPVIGFAMLIALFFAMALKIFVLNPINVGCTKWYLRNRKEDKPKLRAIVEVFSKGYIRIVGIMFLRDLFTFLWTLLLIVPGIIKSYEYRMIPYLLAENPDLTVSEAFALTKKIMNGNKMDTFVLDLSFLPWILLAAVTCGILSVVYVAPYIKLTDTELYVCLCQGKDKYETSN